MHRGRFLPDAHAREAGHVPTTRRATPDDETPTRTNQHPDRDTQFRPITASPAPSNVARSTQAAALPCLRAGARSGASAGSGRQVWSTHLTR